MTLTAIPKPRTFNADLSHLPAPLLPLTKLKHWVIGRWEQTKDGKWTKEPYQAQFYNEHAKSNDAKTWSTYEAAVLAFASGHCDGIGVMLKGSELGAIDLDSPPAFLTPPNLAAAGAGDFHPMTKQLPRLLARFLTPGRH